MTKLQELMAAWDAAWDAAWADTWIDYLAELKKTKEETNNEYGA
tara:strand:+ start:596 stop:727 length:132 start_codon:yes stop_codon:yes gene_type:complete